MKTRLRCHGRPTHRGLSVEHNKNGRNQNMSEREYSLPETLVKIVRTDATFSISLLEGEQLILFPA